MMVYVTLVLTAIIFAYLILKEPLTPSLFAGAALVIGGVCLTNKKQTPA